MFRENDVVKLRHSIEPGDENAWPGTPLQSLPQGSRGTVVMIYNEAETVAYEVEFVAPHGATNALLTLTEEDLEAG
ncbi:DUF4926 domain-containing protein [Nocardia miyunensis]|uniref:DUF4926 domain-containing protein n=1 Tax=Nocardia miyunensis TaxID=282684 RepID=UPI000A01D1E1|nr:DUF4926 domain-containing protein [Nocardia miyunensis]